jgi:hypothetical protein
MRIDFKRLFIVYENKDRIFQIVIPDVKEIQELEYGNF